MRYPLYVLLSMKTIKDIKKDARPSKETPRVNEEIYRQIQALWAEGKEKSENIWYDLCR